MVNMMTPPNIAPAVRETWQVPSFDTPLWLGRQQPWCVVIPVINEGERIKNLLDVLNIRGDILRALKVEMGK